MGSFIKFDEIIAIIVIKHYDTLEMRWANLILIYMYSIES